MFIEILDRLKGERGPLLPKKKPEKELKKIRDANFEKAKPALENPDEVRQMFYDGGVVEFAKKLSDEGKNTDEILEAIQKQFPDLPGGKKGKPTEKTGLQNILKKELSSEVYNQRHGAKRFTQETIDKYLELRDTMNKAQIQKELDISPAKQGQIDKEYGLGRRKSIVTDRKFSPEDIEEFKRLRPIMSQADIRKKIGMSEPYQTQLARELGLESKVGKTKIQSKKIAEAESVVPTIKKMIDPNKSTTENLKEIYPKIKDQTFKKGLTQFGKPTEDRVRRAISNALMDANQLSVEEYKDEIRKMVANRNYVPKGLDPLRMKTDELKNYAIPNYKQAKAELAEEIPSLDRRIQTNINIRKKLKRKQKEIEDPSLKLSRLSQRARNRQIRRIEKLGLAGGLSPREEAINQTQTSIQKSSNDRIKANPEAMKKFLKDNPEKLKALGTRVNRKTGQIFYENPNLSFLNKDPKDTARYFELDHGREISKQAGKLVDTPENRNTIPRLLNQGFKRDAEIYIESNPNPKDPKVQSILDEAKKLKVRIRPKVPTGTFKADDFFRPTPNPLLKIQESIAFYAPDEFQTKEVVLPRDKTGKVFLGLTPQGEGFKKVADAANKSALTELAARTGSGVDPMLLLKAGKEELVDPVLRGAGKVLTSRPAVALASPTAMTGVSASLLAQNPSDPFGYAALTGMGASSKFVADKIKNPLIQRALNLGFKPAQVAKAARFTTPLGIGATAVATLVDSARKFQEEFDALSPEEQQAYLKEQEQFAEDLNRDEFLMAEGGPVDKKRRAVLKILGGIMSLPVLKTIAPLFKLEQAKDVGIMATEGAKLGVEKLMMLINKIKKLGTPDKTRQTQDLQEVTIYKGKDGSEYELVEDLATGDVRVTKDRPGIQVGGDKAYDVIEDRSSFTIKKGRADETTKGKKPPDEYDEMQEVPSRDGTFDDFDDVSDQTIKEIDDELNIKKGFYKGGLTDTTPPKRGPMSQGIAEAYQNL